MYKKLLTSAVAGLMSLFAAGHASAMFPDNYFDYEPAVYGSIEAGYFEGNDIYEKIAEADVRIAPDVSTFTNGFVYGGNIGLQLMRALAVEVGAYKTDEMEVRLDSHSSNGHRLVDADVVTVYGALKGILDFQDLFGIFNGTSIFVKVGGAWTHVSSSVFDGNDNVLTRPDEDGASFVLGAGIAYAFTDYFEAYAQWMRFWDVSTPSTTVQVANEEVSLFKDFDLDIYTIGLAFKYFL